MSTIQKKIQADLSFHFVFYLSPCKVGNIQGGKNVPFVIISFLAEMCLTFCSRKVKKYLIPLFTVTFKEDLLHSSHTNNVVFFSAPISRLVHMQTKRNTIICFTNYHFKVRSHITSPFAFSLIFAVTFFKM